MSSGIFGLEEVLRDLEITSEEIDEAMDDISNEVAIQILEDAIQNVNGPYIGKRKLNHRLKIAGFYKQPYPVAVRTGNLKRSLKIKRMGRARHKVFADRNIASYAYWVHEGHTRMKSRPFLDDAVDYVLGSGRYLDIAGNIIDDVLNK